MKIPLELNGFEGQDLILETAGMLRGARITVDGEPATKGKKRDQFVVHDNNGFKVVVQLKQTLFNPVPTLVIDGQSIKLAKSLNALQWIWSALPIVLVFVGGAIGGAIGAGAFWINLRVFRSEMSASEQFILTGMISVIAVILYLVAASIFGLALGNMIG